MTKAIISGFVLSMFSLATTAGELKSENELNMNQNEVSESAVLSASFDDQSSYGAGYNPNIVKLNVTSLIFRNISLQYERILGPKISVALGVRWMPNGKLPFAGSVQSLLSHDDVEVRDFLDQTKVNAFAITPEFRYYFRTAGRGLYIAPFLRYETFNLTSNYPLEIEGRKYDLDFDGRFNRFGLGALFGWQIRITDNINLDWWIVGPYIASSKLSIHADGFEIDQADYDQYVKDVNDFNVNMPGLKTEVVAERDHASITASGWTPFVHAFGLSFAYRF